MQPSDTRQTLIRTASRLFRQKGYAGTGLAEILTAAELPKGSLYYHFPGGKRELAVAATLWAGEWVETQVERAFDAAEDFDAGVRLLCAHISDTSLRGGRFYACPVLGIVQAAPDEPRLRDVAQQVYARWLACLIRQAQRFGVAEAEVVAGSLHRQLQGAWVLAYAWQSDAPFGELAAEYGAAIGG